MKRTDPLPVGKIVEQMLEQNGVADLYNEQRLCYMWSEIVGPGINRLTSRRFVERTRLVKALNDAVGTEVIHDVKFH